jgi:uncharacterized protein YbaR (Trm112 family)
MPSKFASGKKAISTCDRCGQQYPLRKLKALVIKTKLTNILCCPTCWDPDQPQLQLGLYPVNDPQALRNPRPDNSYFQSGTNNNGTPSGGSRTIQWGWAPVGLLTGTSDQQDALAVTLVRNALHAVCDVGTVTVTTA